MTRYFFDTSALVKRYHPESGTPEVLALLAEPGAAVFVSRLALVECVSAFCVKVRAGHLAANRLPIVRNFLLGDTSRGVLLVTRLLLRHLKLADSLLMRHGATYRLRASDAIHLGVAIDLFRSRGIDAFVSADSVQCEVAKLEGLPIINPLVPAP